MGTPELRAVVAAMKDGQRDNTLILLECNTEELLGLPDGCGVQAVANGIICWTAFQQLSLTQGYLGRIIPKYADGVMSNFLPRY